MTSNGFDDPTMVAAMAPTTKRPSESSSDQQNIEDGDPRPMPYAFEKELIEKSNKNIRLNHEFVPVSKVYALASKFYARHDQQLPPTPERFLCYTEVSQVKRRSSMGLPMLESQVYGWIPTDLDPETLKDLNVIKAPKLRCNMTIHGEHLIAERITERPSFNGLRFLLH